jgi:Sulfotransferase family
LGAPRSFTSLISTMLGQHPQMYGLPEIQFFMCDTMGEFWDICLMASAPMGDGLVRAVAELIYGGQTEETVQRAHGWIRRRFHWTTGRMLEALAEVVAPRIIVEKSTGTVYNRKFLHRFGAMFPDSRYIHLVRHPRGQSESVFKAMKEMQVDGRPLQWLIDLSSYPTIEANQLPSSRNKVAEMDPQNAWFVLNQNVRSFLRTVPPARKLLVRGEDVLSNPDEALRNIAQWLGLRADLDAIEAMKHPEQSPYAHMGPPGAQYGNDALFLKDPVLRPSRAKAQSLDGPLEWRKNGAEFLPEVKQLAAEFGYA